MQPFSPVRSVSPSHLHRSLHRWLRGSAVRQDCPWGGVFLKETAFTAGQSCVRPGKPQRCSVKLSINDSIQSADRSSQLFPWQREPCFVIFLGFILLRCSVSGAVQSSREALAEWSAVSCCVRYLRIFWPGKKRVCVSVRSEPSLWAGALSEDFCS